MFKSIVLIFIIFSKISLAQVIPQDNPRPLNWPNNLWRDVLVLVDDAKYSLTQVLFDQIERFEQDVYSGDYVEAEVKIKREVFNNHDVLNSYSVIDYFGVNLKSNNLNYQIPGVVVNLSLGISLNLGTGLDFVNIRQVKASKYSNLPSVSEEYNFLDDDGNVRVIETQDDGYIDPSWRPRTSELWNFFTIPFRLPTNINKFRNLEDGELVSYGVNGHVELGAGIGFSFIGSYLEEAQDETRVGIEAKYRTFLKGSFRITVLKENNRYARVKVTRSKERGHTLTIGGGTTSDYQLYEGFLLFEGKKLETRVLDTKVKLIPFKFSAHKNNAQVFDLGYRYDLSHPEGRDAYEKAVKGAFALSKELDGRLDEEGNPIVKRLFKRSSGIHTTRHNHEINLNFYTRNHGRTQESTEAVITLEDGVHRVFKEVKSTDKRWKLFWGKYEKLNYNFILSLDKTSFDQGKNNSIQLVAEASIEDSHTSGYEMAQYIEKVEKTLGNDDLLPDLPSLLPSYYLQHNDNTSDLDIRPYNQMARAKYRKSTFYYGFNINQEQLIDFINYPEDNMWSVLEKAFGMYPGSWSSRYSRTMYRLRHILPRIANIPLFLANVHLRRGSDVEAAKKLINQWRWAQKNFQSNGDIILTAKYLGNMFKSKHYGDELLKVLLYSLEEHELDYFLIATNDSFGRIQERGRITTNPEYLLNLTDRNIDFERIAGGYKSNPDILVKKLNIESTEEDPKVRVTFELDHNPKIVYFKLFKSNRLQPFYTIIEIAYDNKTRFKKGLNELYFDKKSLNELSYKLGKDLLSNNFYNLTISTTSDGFSWSKVETKRFFYEYSSQFD